MFVVGVGSVGWMLALAALMAAEKNLPLGRRLRTPVGLGLLGGAAAIVAGQHLTVDRVGRRLARCPARIAAVSRRRNACRSAPHFS